MENMVYYIWVLQRCLIGLLDAGFPSGGRRKYHSRRSLTQRFCSLDVWDWGGGISGGGVVCELSDGCFTSWGLSEVSLHIVFKSPPLAELFSIKQYLVTSK